VGHLGWVQQHEVAEALDVVEKLLSEAKASV
jgi:aspartate aminotransferase-like enzyme